MNHWPWQHSWTAISTQRVISDYLGDGENLKQGIGSPETLVLMRCTCGKVKSTKLRGHWTKEELHQAYPLPNPMVKEAGK